MGVKRRDEKKSIVIWIGEHFREAGQILAQSLLDAGVDGDDIAFAPLLFLDGKGFTADSILIHYLTDLDAQQVRDSKGSIYARYKKKQVSLSVGTDQHILNRANLSSIAYRFDKIHLMTDLPDTPHNCTGHYCVRFNRNMQKAALKNLAWRGQK